MKVIGLLLCFLIAFIHVASSSSGIEIDVNSGSGPYWLAIGIQNAALGVQSVQLQQSQSTTWEAMQQTSGWGYYTYTARAQIKFPVSIRITSTDGHQVTLPNIITSAAGRTIDTGVQFNTGTNLNITTPPPTVPPPTCPPTTPTNSPTPTPSPTDSPTTSPTTAPTSSPTTPAPTAAPTDAPSTAAPTNSPTSAPTRPPTSAPTTKAPTSAPTTKAPTSAPTTKAPTSAPTTKAPTSAPTTKAPTSAPTTKAPTVAPTTGSTGCSGPMKLMVPLYTYPGSTWDTVAASASAVFTVAIINPDSGPGNGPDSTYNTYMPKLKNAGVDMVGYVHTSYGARAIADVKADIDVYASQFPLLVGIFLDEADTAASTLSYYQELYSYIMGMPGWKYDILNPGTVPASGYTAAATQIVSYESAASGFASSQNPSFASCSNKDMFAMITYGATSASDMETAISAAKSKGYYGWVYVTNTGATGATYNSLPSYYAQMATYIASLN